MVILALVILLFFLIWIVSIWNRIKIKGSILILFFFMLCLSLAYQFVHSMPRAVKYHDGIQVSLLTGINSYSIYDDIKGIDFSPDGKEIAVETSGASMIPFYDRTFSLWLLDSKTGKCLFTKVMFTGNFDKNFDGFLGNGNTLLVDDGTNYTIVNSHTGVSVETLPESINASYLGSINHGNTLAFMQNGHIYFQSLETNTITSISLHGISLKRNNGFTCTLATISPNGKMVAFQEGSILKIYSIHSHSVLARLHTLSADALIDDVNFYYTHLEFTPDSKYLIIQGADSEIKLQIYNTTNWKLAFHQPDDSTVAVSSDSHFALLDSDSTHPRLMTVPTWQTLKTENNLPNLGMFAAISANARLVATPSSGTSKIIISPIHVAPNN